MMAVVEGGIPGSAWNQTVSALGGGILQSRSWALLQQEFGRQVYYAKADDWAWLGHIRQSRGISYLYVPYGPIALSNTAMTTAINRLVKAGHHLGVDFVRFEPVGPVSQSVLQSRGAKSLPEVQPRRTLLLELGRSEAQLRSGISQSNRNLINTAQRRGIRCFAIPHPNAEDIDRFIAALRDTVAHNAFRPYTDDYYRRTIEVLGAEQAATLYVGYADDVLVAEAIAFDFAGTRYYAHAAAFHSLNRKHKAAAPLLWQMISDAKNQGSHTFDFWGIASTDDPSHPRVGLTRFKHSFGGQLRKYDGTWDLPVKPVKYRLYRAAKKVFERASA